MSLSAYPEYNSSTIEKQDIRRLFINEKEFNFINKIASEFLQRIAGQFVFYIKIDKNRTSANIYGESKTKMFFDKVKLPASVGEVVKFVNDDAGARYEKDLRVGFLQKLNETYGIPDIFIGDFLEWQQKKYEIINIERHKKIYGAEEFVFEIICICKARE